MCVRAVLELVYKVQASELPVILVSVSISQHTREYRFMPIRWAFYMGSGAQTAAAKAFSHWAVSWPLFLKSYGMLLLKLS